MIKFIKIKITKAIVLCMKQIMGTLPYLLHHALAARIAYHTFSKTKMDLRREPTDLHSLEDLEDVITAHIAEHAYSVESFLTLAVDPLWIF